MTLRPIPPLRSAPCARQAMAMRRSKVSAWPCSSKHITTVAAPRRLMIFA